MLMKRLTQQLLSRLGIYYRTKESCLYDMYWRVANPEQLRRRSGEIEFYRGVLRGLKPGDIIFDVGANEGNKTSVFLRFGARVVAVDPDKTNQDILQQRFLKLRLVRKPVAIVCAALSRQRGFDTLWVDQPGSAKNTLNRKWVDTLRGSSRFGEPLTFAQQLTVETMTLDDLISVHGRPFFIKIDVEGAEPEVLRGLHSPVPFVSFEINLPEFRAEGLQCIESLERLAPGGGFNYTVDCGRGLELKRWLPAADFCTWLHRCNDLSIDVLWRAPSCQPD